MQELGAGSSPSHPFLTPDSTAENTATAHPTPQHILCTHYIAQEGALFPPLVP